MVIDKVKTSHIFQFALNKKGIIRNIGSVGKTNQKVASAWSAMLLAFLFSIHIQIIAKIEISGTEAMRAPNPGYFLAISEIKAIKTPEITALITSKVIF